MIFCVALAELRVLLEWEVLITPALRDVAEDCGAVRMARLGDVDDLYRVLTPLLQSREERLQQSQISLRRAEQLSLPNVLQQWETMLNERG